MLDSIDYHDVMIETVADADAIDAALAALSGLAPAADSHGNIQGVFRIEQTDSGFVATVPTTVDAGEVLQAVAEVSKAAAAVVAAAVARTATTEEILDALQQTDVWVLRAVEEGIPLTDPRKAYREQLRELLLQAATVDDPTTITIPAAPNWVPATT